MPSKFHKPLSLLLLLGVVIGGLAFQIWLSGPAWPGDTEEHIPFVYEKDLSETVNAFIAEMEKDFDFKLGGWGQNLDEKINSMHLDFHAYQRATIDEARALELVALDRFAKALNANEKIQPYLSERPFNQVSIEITFVGDLGRYADGSINTVSNSHAFETIHYTVVDPFQSDLINSEESYEEARKLNASSGLQFPYSHQSTPLEAVIDKFFWDFTHKMWDERQIQPYDIGGKMDGQIEEISGSFVQVHHRANKKEARDLAIFFTQRLLHEINSDEKLRPFLAFYPFPVDRLKIKLEFKDDVEDDMESVTITDNEISYYQHIITKYNDGFDAYGTEFHRVEFTGKESYQEALRIVSGESKYSKLHRETAFQDGLL